MVHYHLIFKGRKWYVDVFVYIYIFVYIYLFIYIFIYIFVYIYIHKHTHIYMYISEKYMRLITTLLVYQRKNWMAQGQRREREDSPNDLLSFQKIKHENIYLVILFQQIKSNRAIRRILEGNYMLFYIFFTKFQMRNFQECTKNWSQLEFLLLT